MMSMDGLQKYLTASMKPHTDEDIDVIHVCDVFFQGFCDQCNHPCFDYMEQHGYSEEEEWQEYEPSGWMDYTADPYGFE